MIDYVALAHRFWREKYGAIALFGSHARGDAGPYSDVDLNVIGPEDGQEPPVHTHVVDGHLVNVTLFTPADVEQWFTDLDVLGGALVGIRQARPLIDPDGVFSDIQARARAFRWDETWQARADEMASRRMVGWIEEMFKGLEGLRRGHTGRYLAASFAYTWGLVKVMQYHHGVLLGSDNDLHEAVASAVGPETTWSLLMSEATGTADAGKSTLSLRQRTLAGLRLYAVTARQLDAGGALRDEDRPLILYATRVIEEKLSK